MLGNGYDEYSLFLPLLTPIYMVMGDWGKGVHYIVLDTVGKGNRI